MKVGINIPSDRIAQLFSAAIETIDPVTSAWCAGIYNRAAKRRRGFWYAKPEVYDAKDFRVEVVEYDEDKDKKFSHFVDRRRLMFGLRKMAQIFPAQFSQVLEDNIDAPCADAFLQSIAFGKERYS